MEFSYLDQGDIQHYGRYLSDYNLTYKKKESIMLTEYNHWIDYELDNNQLISDVVPDSIMYK